MVLHRCVMYPAPYTPLLTYNQNLQFMLLLSNQIHVLKFDQILCLLSETRASVTVSLEKWKLSSTNTEHAILNGGAMWASMRTTITCLTEPVSQQPRSPQWEAVK
jgi:hypothetical protein